MPLPPLPEIIVTGHALPTGGERVFAPVVIDRQRLTLNASGRIENLLTDVAGFQSFRRADSRASNPTAQGAVLRGLGGNASARVLVLLDGVPQGDPFFGSIAFNAIVPGEIDRVSVTRGAGAGPFGLGGVAGVVEIESAGPGDLGPASASLAVGSRFSVDGQAEIAPRWNSGFATFAGRIEHGAGFWTTPLAQRSAASVRSAYDGHTVSGRIVTGVEGGELQAGARWFDDQRLLRFRGAENRSSGRDASLRWVKRGRWSLDVLAYAQKRNFSTVVVSATSFRPVLNQGATPSTGLGGRVEIRSPAWRRRPDRSVAAG
ncbi:MAG: TonB-dependent receptor plug domain-containing protein [Sphingomonadales bacterium]|nr:TonB-dependent receptor plug domain-containing protein [Sphingomonadales bacterium]